MIRDLRAIADVLFLPMTFDAAGRNNMTVSFPSKFTDYTATGLPLLIYGPPYSSAVRWARSFDDVAEIVDRESVDALREAIARIAADHDRRAALAGRAVAIGRQCFDPEGARAALAAALGGVG